MAHTTRYDTRLLRRGCYALLAVEALLGVAHLLWPEYRWGQGRRSYFNLGNSLTLASWLISVQLAVIAVLGLVAFLRERWGRQTTGLRASWAWLAGALGGLTLSFVELTRVHVRLELFGYPSPDPYQSMMLLSLAAILLGLGGWFLINRTRQTQAGELHAKGWLLAWGAVVALAVLSAAGLIPRSCEDWAIPVSRLGYLIGCTLLLTAVGQYRCQPVLAPKPAIVPETAGPAVPRSQLWTLAGVGGTTFALIFLQVLLFRMLTIFGDHLAANSVISVALLGIAAGGLIGFYRGQCSGAQTMIGASLLLPVSILLAFGVSVSLMDTPLLASILLAVPFVCGSAVITVALVQADSRVVYFIDLLGAAAGALLIGTGLSGLREEGCFFALAAFALLVAGCFVALHADRRVRRSLRLFAVTAAVLLAFVAHGNVEQDWLNVVRTKLQRRYPSVDVLFSRSSFVGRYDVARREPGHKSLSTYDTGRIIDTVRQRPTESYQIDPRVPHTLMEDPSILIIGLSGDGISKTAKALGKSVTGIEINPVTVDLQRNELAALNADSYRGIDVHVMDGRSYMAQCDRQYDIITLMNAHLARGRTAGRSPSPEYLHTYEAIDSYLEHLTDRGVLVFEEPVSRPRREVPVWKLIVTIRQVLADRGASHPERHLFVFQWKTKTNNYIQIVAKRTPFIKPEAGKLAKWLADVDELRRIEDERDRRMGPIHARTTALHWPHRPLATIYSRILSGPLDDDLARAYNLCATTDDSPFHFDVDPKRAELKRTYGRALVLALFLAPFFLGFLVRYRAELSTALPHVLVVTLTGLGYLLVEVVLMQRYAIFLGSPVVSFATVLGTLLVCSGFGSLWSGRLDARGLCAAVAAIVALLLGHILLGPRLFQSGVSLSLPGKVMLSILSLAPLGFFLGVPFPFVMRAAKTRFTPAAAAMLFAINGAASALAVPLEINLSVAVGLNATFALGVTIYVLVAILLVALHKHSIRKIAVGIGLAAVALLLLGPWLGDLEPIAEAAGPERYQVYGVSYGRSARTESKVLANGSRSKRVGFEWLLWVVQGRDRTVLVDTGFESRAHAKEWGIGNYVSPSERLRQLGISPPEVDDVVLTHAHWDHLGGVGLYRHARIWIQEKEYEHLKATVRPDRPEAKGLRLNDRHALALAEKEGRLRLLDGEYEIAPGITVTPAGGHTPGSQYVTASTLVGPVIVAGDVCYLYENSQKHIPVAGAYDDEEALAAIRAMHSRAASPFFILPGHDPRVMKWFPSVSEGIVEITPVAR